MPSSALPSDVLYEAWQEGTRDVTAIPKGMLRLVDEAFMASGEEAAAGEGLAAIEAGGEAGAALASSGLILILVAVAALFILASWLHHLLHNALASIPFTGGKLAVPIDIAFYWVTPGMGFLADTLNQEASKALPSFVHLVGWCLQNIERHMPSPFNAVIESYVHPVKAEVDHLWSWVHDISVWVSDLSHSVHGNALIGSDPMGAIRDQVHQLQRDVATIQHIQTVQAGDIAAINGQLATLGAEQATLTEHTVGVRAASIGAADLLTVVSNLQASVHELQTVVLPTVTTHTGQINTLYPLGILLDAGALGLQNLRKLEDDPCQCPRLPGVINELGLAMSALHHLKGD